MRGIRIDKRASRRAWIVAPTAETISSTNTVAANITPTRCVARYVLREKPGHVYLAGSYGSTPASSSYSVAPSA